MSTFLQKPHIAVLQGKQRVLAPHHDSQPPNPAVPERGNTRFPKEKQRFFTVRTQKPFVPEKGNTRFPKEKQRFFTVRTQKPLVLLVFLDQNVPSVPSQLPPPDPSGLAF